MAVHTSGIAQPAVHQVGAGLGLEYSDRRVLIPVTENMASTAIGVIADF